MSGRPYLALVHYDGAQFAGWQRQPGVRTVQADIETALERLMGERTVATGAGRTDAGVHALGQGVSFSASERWHTSAADLRRALNALLPPDIWVECVHAMQLGFDARRRAVARRYRYLVGTDEGSRSPFRRRYEWPLRHAVDPELLERAAGHLMGEHAFYGLAAVGAASDDYRCRVVCSRWEPRPDGQGVAYSIEADRFLYRMVRFLVGTMVDIALRRRPIDDLPHLLAARDNQDASPPAPPQGLYLTEVRYRPEDYCTGSEP